jgi:hypothetical protein
MIYHTWGKRANHYTTDVVFSEHEYLYLAILNKSMEYINTTGIALCSKYLHANYT